MPFCYGGGVKTVEQARTIIGLGVEKVAISSALVEDPTLASRIAEKIGRQSVVGVMDVKKKRFSSRYEIWTHNAGKNTHLNPLEFAQVLEQHGVGEIIVNSIDHDGVMKGYDLDLVQQIRERTTVPLSVLGGAGSLADIRALISKFGIIGAGAGSLFVFKGAYKAVLINYPTPQDREVLLREANKAA